MNTYKTDEFSGKKIAMFRPSATLGLAEFEKLAYTAGASYAPQLRHYIIDIAKADELMALLDRAEEQVRERRAARYTQDLQNSSIL